MEAFDINRDVVPSESQWINDDPSSTVRAETHPQSIHRARKIEFESCK